MDYVKATLGFALFVFLMLLFARIILSLVIAYAREWRPRGAMLVATEGVFMLTDPPVKAIRRVIPPITLGQVRIDLAVMILFFVCMIGYNMLARR